MWRKGWTAADGTVVGAPGVRAAPRRAFPPRAP